MLGQLLHSFSPSRRGTPRPLEKGLESVTEDVHTRNLLFPDALTLSQPDSHLAFPQSLSSSSTTVGPANDGTQPGIDLDHNRDFRILIAQDEAGSMPRTVLFDSKHPQLCPEPALTVSSDQKTSDMAAPKVVPSLTAQAPAPVPPNVSVFQRARTRGASVLTMYPLDESAQSARLRESEEMVKTCLDCMFGTAPMAYRGPSNKLHIIPMDQSASDRNTTSPTFHEGFGSLGRPDSRTRSRLAASYTASTIPLEPSPPSPEAATKQSRRRTILITRLFSVSTPEDVELPAASASNSATPTPGATEGATTSFPFPGVGSDVAPPMHATGPTRPCRTPMYAIGILIHLPASSPSARSASQKAASSKPHHAGQDSPGSSFDSDRRAGWAFVDPTFGVDSLHSNSTASDVDDRVDVIGKHWDIIIRTLTSLQFVVQDKIMELFKAAEKQTPQPQPSIRAQSSATRRQYREPLIPPRRMLKLQPFALLLDPDVKTAAECAADRMSRGINLPRVLTGQGRWVAWREESRWLCHWAGNREQNFFFYNLLAAFLGTHTDWLSILWRGPYKERQGEQHDNPVGENTTIANRTIIISPDKMACRRLIFVLTNFFPPSHHMLSDTASPVRPSSTSISTRALSHPPLTGAGMMRQTSLRRTINRKGHKSHPNMASLNTANSSGSDVSDDKPQERYPPRRPSRSVPQSRRHSQAHSTRPSNAAGLAMPSWIGDPAMHTGRTATTTSTVIPEAAIPVPHFTSNRKSSVSASPDEARPPSSGSTSGASVNLRHTLQRTTSGPTAHVSNSTASKWESFMSILTSGTRRQSPPDHGNAIQPVDDSVVVGAPGYKPAQNRPGSKPEHATTGHLRADESNDAESLSREPLVDAGQPPLLPAAPHSAARAIPSRSQPFGSSLKLSVNENDGVIDVDIALPGFGSPMQSPLLPTLGNSMSSLDESAFGPPFCSSVLPSECQPPTNVAGWLARYHQDFALQAVPPYPDLDAEIRKSMSAEPTPVSALMTLASDASTEEAWVPVCTVIKANTENYEIIRTSLERRVKLKPTTQSIAPQSQGLPKSQYGNPYAQASNLTSASPMTEIRLEERFIEEVVMDFDETLVRAVEKGVLSVPDPAPALKTRSIHSANATPTHHAPQYLTKTYTPSTIRHTREPEHDDAVSLGKSLPSSCSVGASTSSSPSSSVRGRPCGLAHDGNHPHARRDAASTPTSLETAIPSHIKCKNLVIGALRDIVCSVAAGPAVSSTSKRVTSVASHSVAESMYKENTLREGIRRWLNQVEDGS